MTTIRNGSLSYIRTALCRYNNIEEGQEAGISIKTVEIIQAIIAVLVITDPPLPASIGLYVELT